MNAQVAMLCYADVTLKCLPHEKSAWGEIITDLKYRHKKSPRYRTVPQISLPWPTIYQ